MSKSLLRVLIPVIMVGGILGMYFLQEYEKSQLTEIQVDNPDFALYATEINLTELKKHALPIIIDFGADSCIPCKEMAPVLRKLNEEFQNKAIIKFVDVWKNPAGVGEFPVQVIPTQFIYDNTGKPYHPTELIDKHKLEITQYFSKETKELLFTVHQGGLTEEQMRAILEDMSSRTLSSK